jgi:HAE1 family hydrophobic/amphiphilic exporter-1
MVAKFKRRAERRNPLLAFLSTFTEALLTLTFVRFLWRMLARLAGRARRRGANNAVQTV